jgi:hypothetical protein
VVGRGFDGVCDGHRRDGRHDAPAAGAAAIGGANADGVALTSAATLIPGLSVARHTEMMEVTFADWLDRAVPRERQRNAFIVASVAMSIRVGLMRRNGSRLH